MILEDVEMDMKLKQDLVDYIEDLEAEVLYVNKKCTVYRTIGIPQGGAASPMLFIYYLDNLIRKFVKTTKLWAFADNIAFLTTPELFQKKYDEIEQLLMVGNLELNPLETNYLMLGKQDTLINYNKNIIIKKMDDQSIIERSRTIKYLGINIAVSEKYKAFGNVREKIEKIEKWFWTPQLMYAPFFVRRHYLKAYINSTLAYEYVIELMNIQEGKSFVIEELYNMTKKVMGDFKWAYKDMMIMKLDPLYSTLVLWTKLNLDMEMKERIIILWTEMEKIKTKVRNRMVRTEWNTCINNMIRANRDELLKQVDVLRTKLWNLKGEPGDISQFEDKIKYKYTWIAYGKKEIKIEKNMERL